MCLLQYLQYFLSSIFLVDAFLFLVDEYKLLPLHGILPSPVQISLIISLIKNLLQSLLRACNLVESAISAGGTEATNKSALMQVFS